jgi:hypothetical protein
MPPQYHVWTKHRVRVVRDHGHAAAATAGLPPADHLRFAR